MPRKRFDLHMPLLILLILAVDLILGGLFLFDKAIYSPSSKLRDWLDFEHEAAVATWFSSMQLFAVAAVLSLFSWGVWMAGEGNRLSLLALPMLFLVLSADEVIQIHEWIGYKLFSVERRQTSIFGYVGIWGFVLGPLVLACAGWLIWRLRRYIASDPRVLRLFVLGFVVFIGAGAFVEELANFVELGGTSHMWQVFVEEMGEMIGVTLLLWAAWELLRQHGLQRVLVKIGEHVRPGATVQ